MNGPWTETADGLHLWVRVLPRAGKTEIAEVRETDLRIRLQAPPVDGKANKELVAFLAKTLGVKKSQVDLVAGEKSRDKSVRVTGVTAEQMQETVT